MDKAGDFVRKGSQARGQQGSWAYAEHAGLSAQLRLPAMCLQDSLWFHEYCEIFFFWILVVGFGTEVGSQSRSQILLMRRSAV